MSTQSLSLFALLAVLITVTHLCHCATMAPLCEPGIVEEMPAHIKKVCIALENSDQLSNALKTYIKNEADALVSKSGEWSSNYGKRTDVDHVFLRFGKKR